jgi:hypothetical protein
MMMDIDDDVIHPESSISQRVDYGDNESAFSIQPQSIASSNTQASAFRNSKYDPDRYLWVVDDETRDQVDEIRVVFLISSTWLINRMSEENHIVGANLAQKQRRHQKHGTGTSKGSLRQQASLFCDAKAVKNQSPFGILQ